MTGNVGEVDGSFKGCSQDTDDAAEGGGGLEEWEEVEDEAEAGVGDEGEGEGQTFFRC